MVSYGTIIAPILALTERVSLQTKGVEKERLHDGV